MSARWLLTVFRTVAKVGQAAPRVALMRKELSCHSLLNKRLSTQLQAGSPWRRAVYRFEK